MEARVAWVASGIGLGPGFQEASSTRLTSPSGVIICLHKDRGLWDVESGREELGSWDVELEVQAGLSLSVNWGLCILKGVIGFLEGYNYMCSRDSFGSIEVFVWHGYIC